MNHGQAQVLDIAVCVIAVVQLVQLLLGARRAQ